jgi:single-strand DNA-binding protein
VLVTGRLRQRTWETDDGERRQVIEIEADEIAASLRFHTATLTRATRARAGYAFHHAAPAEAGT